jgi:hypothetical protein
LSIERKNSQRFKVETCITFFLTNFFLSLFFSKKYL